MASTLITEVQNHVLLGNEIHYPMNKIPIYNNSVGTSSVTRIASSYFNNYGDDSSVALSNPSNSTGVNKASFTCLIYGGTIGIRHKMNPTAARISSNIDGMGFDLEMDEVTTFWQNQPFSPTDTGLINKDGVWIIARGLEQKWHDVEVFLPPASNGSANGNEILGFVVEQSTFYQPVIKLDRYSNRLTLSASFQNIPLVDSGTALGLPNPSLGIKVIKVVNNDSVPQTITINNNNSILDQKTLAVGESWHCQLSETGVSQTGLLNIMQIKCTAITTTAPTAQFLTTLL